MRELQDIKNLILLSLYEQKGTLQELCKRDFLNNYSKLGIESLVNSLIQDKFIDEVLEKGRYVLKVKKSIKNNILKNY